MPIYIELFHGRRSPTEELNDWGVQGPVFGPLGHVHTTYSNEIKLGAADGDLIGELHTINDMIYYDGWYYGDWSVFGEECLGADGKLATYSESAAEPPGTVHGPNGWRMIPTEAG